MVKSVSGESPIEGQKITPLPGKLGLGGPEVSADLPTAVQKAAAKKIDKLKVSGSAVQGSAGSGPASTLRMRKEVVIQKRSATDDDIGLKSLSPFEATAASIREQLHKEPANSPKVFLIANTIDEMTYDEQENFFPLMSVESLCKLFENTTLRLHEERKPLTQLVSVLLTRISIFGPKEQGEIFNTLSLESLDRLKDVAQVIKRVQGVEIAFDELQRAMQAKR